jgi:recombination protein RecA
MKLGVTFGSPETTTGGNALKYYASVRLDVRRVGQVKIGEEVVGHRTRVKVVKNKMAPPFQVSEIDIRYGVGIDAVGDLLDAAVALEKIEKNGSFYAFAGQSLGQGREKARLALIEDAKLRDAVESAVRLAAVSGTMRAKPALEEAAA